MNALTRDLHRMAKEGKTASEAARDLRMTRQAVQDHAKRRGVDFMPQYHRTLRDKAEAMPLEEARDFLLMALDDICAAMASNAPHPVDGWGVHLTPTQRRIAVCLYEHEGTRRTADQIYACMALGSDDLPQRNTMRQHISQLRAKVRRFASIDCAPGVGYRMDLRG